MIDKICDIILTFSEVRVLRSVFVVVVTVWAAVHMHSIFIYLTTYNDSHFVHFDKYNLTSFQHLDTHKNLRASALAIRLWFVGKIQVFFLLFFLPGEVCLGTKHKNHLLIRKCIYKLF